MVNRSHWQVRRVKADNHADDLKYWSDKSISERLSAVEIIRRNFYAVQGHNEIPRIKRVVSRVKMM